MSTRERCAPAAELRGDQLHATAAPARFFVLVEQPGSVGAERGRPTGSAAIPPATELLRRTHDAGARLLLVRRLHREPGEPRRWALVDVRPGSESARWGTFDDDRELDLLDPREPVGEPSSGPIVLVCTHGRRDACCAQRGWPVAAALTEAFPTASGSAPTSAAIASRERRDPPEGPLLRAADAVERARRRERHLDGRVAVEALRGARASSRRCRPRSTTLVRRSASTRSTPCDRSRSTGGGTASSRSGSRARGRGARRGRRGISPPIERLTCGATEATSVRTWSAARADDRLALRGSGCRAAG